MAAAAQHVGTLVGIAGGHMGFELVGHARHIVHHGTGGLPG
jgi:hypothetical protein